jgi:hypothetical protein
LFCPSLAATIDKKTQFNDVYNYYVPTIIKKGCQLKNRHPAPSGLVAA